MSRQLSSTFSFLKGGLGKPEVKWLSQWKVEYFLICVVKLLPLSSVRRNEQGSTANAVSRFK